MAEIAGLVVSIASLAGLFRTCTVFLDRIDCARHIEKSSTILLKYEIVKHSFKEWGRHSGVSEDAGRPSSVPNLLGAQDKQSLVYGILACVEQLFIDAEALETRYGLSLPRSASSTPRQDSPSSLQLFWNTMKGVNSPKQRLLWAIRDEKRFDDLVTVLSGFTDRLYELIPVNDKNAELAKTLEEWRLAIDSE